MKTLHTSSGRKAFTLVEIMIVVSIIGLLAAIAIPNYAKARQSSRTSVCIENMRLISGAKSTWAIENRKMDSDTPTQTDLFGRALYLKAEPKCPSNEGVTYVLGSVSANVECPNVGIELDHVLAAQ